MREEAFRQYLAERLRPNAVTSYLSNLRAVERALGTDLDASPPTEIDPARVKERLLDHMSLARARDCVSALRQYSAFAEGTERPPRVPRQSSTNQLPISAHPLRAAFVRAASVAELMRLYADVLGELRDRGVTRTANGPVGDYAEALFARAFGWTLAGNSAASFDATDAAGGRYQIKARRMGGPGARQLGAIRRLPDAGFDQLAAILFDRDLQVFRAALIPYRIVVERARRVEHTNSWRFMLGDDVWALPTVRDATETIRAAAATL